MINLPQEQAISNDIDRNTHIDKIESNAPKYTLAQLYKISWDSIINKMDSRERKFILDNLSYDMAQSFIITEFIKAVAADAQDKFDKQ